MEVYIDALPILREDEGRATLCVFLLKDDDIRVVAVEAPQAKSELEAKYFALEKALESIHGGRPPEAMKVYTDCWMLLNQLQGRYEVKDPDFLRHKARVEELLGRHASAELHYIPKAENPAHEALVRHEAEGDVSS